MKKICFAGIGLVSSQVANAIEALPKVKELEYYDNKKEDKKKKKRLRELARRQKRLDKMKAT